VAGTVDLPPKLIPGDGSPGRQDRPLDPSRPTGALAPLTPRYQMPSAVVIACRSAIEGAALPLGAVQVDVVGAAEPRRSRDGGLSAPMEARIVYARNGRPQVRQARVTCQFNAGGQVVAAL
jgi:hypothetical protein